MFDNDVLGGITKRQHNALCPAPDVALYAYIVEPVSGWYNPPALFNVESANCVGP